MGYGDGTKNYERKRFENAKRMKIHKERFLKGENAPQALRGLGIPPESGESINNALNRAAWRKE